MIAGVVLAYRGKYLKGLLLTAIFSAFEVQANHVQMTYYYLFIILFMVIAFLADAIKKVNSHASERLRRYAWWVPSSVSHSTSRTFIIPGSTVRKPCEERVNS